MGLLTDPSSGQGKLTKILLKYYQKLGILLYVGGVVWFCALASRDVNNSTYFSENALLPGLVKSEFNEDVFAERLYKELLDEMKKYDDSIPYSWILAKFKQMGLDTYTHNFTLNYPLGKAKKYFGKNVYGILRAARASSTESLILSVPYRSAISPHLPTAPSIALLLAFANFANREKYWAKDIIFLITEHEQLGVQAWLEAYHGVQCGDEDTLNSGDLDGRAGAIQAAINLELHDIHVGKIDIKIEGLNGQLPNLDLFNLVVKMCNKDGVYNTFKNRDTKDLKDPYKDWLYSMHTLLSMVATQATGIPNGNHGLFHRFGIEALTIEGFSNGGKGAGKWRVDFLVLGRIIEGTFRSLNNLLERFHQSFFFYLLPSSSRYISIGLYMPALCAIIGALYIKACAKWCQLQGDEPEKEKDSTKKKQPGVSRLPLTEKQIKELPNEFKRLVRDAVEEDPKAIHFGDVLTLWVLCHVFGILLMNSPQFLTSIGESYGYAKDVSVFYGFVLASIMSLVAPIFLRFRSTANSLTILNIFCLLEFGTVLLCIGMNNFSLAFICSIISVPFALLISENTSCTKCFIVQKIFWLIVHPMLILTAAVLLNTYLLFSDESFEQIFYKGIEATQQAIVFGIVDWKIYGNWVYSLVTAILLPNWLCFWYVTWSKASVEVCQEKKTN